MGGLGSILAEIVFWGCLFLLSYIYLGYPTVIAGYALLRGREPLRRDDCPPVSIVVVAHDEGARIEQRISNLLGLDYPSARIEILIASDGSADDTAARAERHASERLRVIAFDERRGKAAVLNDVIPAVQTEIVVLTDARQRFAPGTLRALLRPFADPQVGAVSGELMLEGGDAASSAVGEGVDFYWRYEKLIRVSESTVDSTVGATGAVYAIRKALFRPIETDTLLDDVVIPMQITRQGFRVVFERDAIAYDRLPPNASAELARKVRTIAGNFQLFARHRWLLNPWENRLWFQSWSHKLARLLSPLALIGTIGANLLLLERPLYRWLLALQLAFYGAAFVGYGQRKAAASSRLVSVPYAFCLLNWATILAFVRFSSGRQAVTWERG